MKQKIKELLTPVSRKTENRLRQLCGKPTPAKRLVMVLVAFFMLAAFNIYFLFSSVKNIGKNEVKKELMKLEHIEGIKLPNNDSINNLLKQKMYEYE